MSKKFDLNFVENIQENVDKMLLSYIQFAKGKIMSECVLAVDDSRVILKMATRLLQEVFGECEIITFTNPEEAITKIKEGNIKVKFALLDYNMNEMTGVELAEQLVALDSKPLEFTKIAIVSANVQEAVQKKATGLGMDFIPKPLDKDKLINFLNEKGISYA